MKKTTFFIVLLFSIINLSACNEQADSETITEADIIDENLNLKDQIAELEMELDMNDQQKQKENEVENQLLFFFQQVIIGNIDEAKNIAGNQIQVDTSALTLSDGSEVILPDNDPYIMSFSDPEWEGANSICISVAISKRETQSSLKVFLTKEDGVWKIENITS